MLLLLVSLLLISPVVESGPPHIGRGFSLPETSVFQLSVEGKSIFSGLQESCYVKQTSTRNRAESLTFRTPESFYQHLGINLGLMETEIVPKNLYRSLLDVSKSISPELEVVGAGIEISRESYSVTLSPECRDKTQLNEQLISDFKKLPTQIHNPSRAGSWLQYDTFLKTYGTHYISAVFYGNKINNFIFAKKTYGYTEEELSAAACLKLQLCGLTFCSYPESLYDRVRQFATSQHYEVRGGTAGTRLNMTLGDVTEEDLYNFIRSESDEEEHTRVTLQPLVTVLKHRFLGSEHFSRALILQQYYEGFLVRGCEERSVGGVLTQRFTLTSSLHSLPEFRCELALTGCRSDSDCHLEASTIWTHCYCYGPTCITGTTWRTADLGTYETRAAQRSLHGSTYEGENLSCHYRVGPWCQCDHTASNQWDTIWPDPKSDFSHDLSLYRELYRDINGSARMGRSVGITMAFCLLLFAVFS